MDSSGVFRHTSTGDRNLSLNVYRTRIRITEFRGEILLLSIMKLLGIKFLADLMQTIQESTRKS